MDYLCDKKFKVASQDESNKGDRQRDGQWTRTLRGTIHSISGAWCSVLAYNLSVGIALQCSCDLFLLLYFPSTADWADDQATLEIWGRQILK